ncbi:hypothetical protein ACJX0J_033324 [Zea mays]
MRDGTYNLTVVGFFWKEMKSCLLSLLLGGVISHFSSPSQDRYKSSAQVHNTVINKAIIPIVPYNDAVPPPEKPKMAFVRGTLAITGRSKNGGLSNLHLLYEAGQIGMKDDDKFMLEHAIFLGGYSEKFLVLMLKFTVFCCCSSS